MSAVKPPPVIEPGLVTGLLLLSGLAVLPLSRHFPPWIGGFFYAVLGLRWLLQWRGLRPPGRLVIGLLAAAGLALVLAIYHHPIGRDPGSALLLVMTGLKLLETGQRRDLYVGVFLGLFLLVVQSLFDQDLLVNVYLLIISLALIALLNSAHGAAPRLGAVASLRQLGLLLAPALPLAVVLFFLFPRLSAPLWSLYTPTDSGVTGFGSRLAPGLVSRLSQSEKVAFRVDFGGPPPPQDQLYWRGLVFVGSDGRNWELDRFAPLAEADLALLWDDEIVDYTLTLEPHTQRWLFGLDLPVAAPPGTEINSAFELRAQRPVNERTRYALRSSPVLRNDWITPRERAAALALPDNVTPRMRELAGRWRALASGPEGVVRLALEHFRNEPFYYSLTPPAALVNPADQFLFETRTGFCEHYATSFTLLMRIAGLPARVVTGYQGGELNPHSGYLVVRQSDAHAWAEVWLQSSGWTRVDPTAAVAPERIQAPLDPGLLIGGAPIRFSGEVPSFLHRLAREAGLLWDAVNTGWNDWILYYSSSKQSALMDWLGLGFLRQAGMGVALVLICLAIMVLTLLVMLGRERRSVDPVQHLYLDLCQRLARQGLVRKPHEGPRDYTARVARARPDLAPQLRPITSLYLRLRYGHGGSVTELRQLRRLVGRFRPRRRRAEGKR